MIYGSNEVREAFYQLPTQTQVVWSALEVLCAENGFQISVISVTLNEESPEKSEIIVCIN